MEFVLGRFHTLTLQLPILTHNSVAPELQVFVSLLQISAKRAHSCVAWLVAIDTYPDVVKKMYFLLLLLGM